MSTKHEPLFTDAELQAARAKDAELIQKLVGALQDTVDAWDDGDLDTAIISRLRTVLREVNQ